MNINGPKRLIRSQAKTVNYTFGSYSKFSVKPLDACVMQFLLIFFLSYAVNQFCERTVQLINQQQPRTSLPLISTKLVSLI